MNAKMLACTAITAASLIAAPAFADQVKFSYKPFELDSPAGIASLYARMESRAEAACAARSPSISARRIAQECTEKLLSEFVEGVGNGQLSAVHEAKSEERYALGD